MKRLLPTAAVLACLILPQAAQAANVDEEQLPKVARIFVQVADGVTGGCLPSPNVLQVEAELILRRSGIAVTETTAYAYRLLIALGGKPDPFSGTPPTPLD